MEQTNQHRKDFITAYIIFLMLIPLWLRLEEGVWRDSISSYFRMSGESHSFTLYMVMVFAAFLYDFGGNRQRWWNLISALSMLGLTKFDMYNTPIEHYCFAGVFFATTNITMILRMDKNSIRRKFAWLVSGFTTLVLILSVATPLLTILAGEWVGLIPMGILLIVGIHNKSTWIERFFYRTYIKFLKK